MNTLMNTSISETLCMRFFADSCLNGQAPDVVVDGVILDLYYWTNNDSNHAYFRRKFDAAIARIDYQLSRLS